jgi:hypothetical protein
MPYGSLTIRIAVVVPAWHQSQYLAEAVQSALDQEIETGVGVVIVNDGCPEPETHRTGEAMRDAHPDRVAYLHQPNAGLSAARNAGIRHGFARWPQVEAIFPLDADNQLSPHTLAKLSGTLEARPEAAWATPALEFFGNEEGEWLVPGPYLPYRQLFANQCDAGSLIRRAVFAAGHEYEEAMRDGFEDWEFFLSATLSGFGGAQAGRCGFRYRRHGETMLTAALRKAAAVEEEIRRRHSAAYEPAALAHREHEEAPRFALVRCDSRDVLLTANGYLQPRQLPLAEFSHSIASAGSEEPASSAPVPAITVLTTAATIDRLVARGSLQDALFQLQAGLRDKGVVGLSAGAGATPPAVAALAVRASQLPRLHDDARPAPEALIPIEALSEASAEPLPEPQTAAAAVILGTAAGESMPLPANSHSCFLEHLHIDAPQGSVKGVAA